MEILAFYAIAIEPIKIQTHSKSQNDRLNLSFVKDKHTYGKKVARKGRTEVIYKGTFISKQSLCIDFTIFLKSLHEHSM